MDEVQFIILRGVCSPLLSTSKQRPLPHAAPVRQESCMCFERGTMGTSISPLTAFGRSLAAQQAANCFPLALFQALVVVRVFLLFVQELSLFCPWQIKPWEGPSSARSYRYATPFLLEEPCMRGGPRYKAM